MGAPLKMCVCAILMCGWHPKYVGAPLKTCVCHFNVCTRPKYMDGPLKMCVCAILCAGGVLSIWAVVYV